MAERNTPLWVRVGRVYREKGPFGVWFGALSKLGYRRLVLLEASLEEPVPRFSPRVEAEIRPLVPEDESAFVALRQDDSGMFGQRSHLGHECWGAWVSGRLRHVAWSGLGQARVEYLRCRLVLDERVAYAYRAYTEPAYRGLGLCSATQSACLSALRARGYRLGVAGVLPDNPGAFAPWLRVGYRRFGVVRALGAGRRPRVFVRLDQGGGVTRGWRFERSSDNELREGPDPPPRWPIISG